MWGIGKGILILLDGFFNIINQIWRFEFFNNEFVVNIFNASVIIACSWLGVKVLIDLIMNFIIHDETHESPLNVFKGIILAITMMFLIPSLFNFGSQISTSLTEAVISISNMSESANAEQSLSSAIVRSMVYENETKPENITDLVNNWRTIDINASEGGFIGFGDCYKYSINFFMLIVISIVTVFLLFFVAIQIAKRVMELALYKIVAPFCAISLTSKQSRTFEIWCKATMGAFLITVVQFVGIGLLLNLFGTAFESAGRIGGIFLVIGALLFIISTPTLIGSLLNQQSGLASGLGDMQSLVAVGMATSQGFSFAKAGVMGALGLGAQVAHGVGGGLNMIGNKLSSFYNWVNRNSRMTEDQKESVQSDFQHFNTYRAQSKTRDYTSQNGNWKYQGSSSSDYSGFYSKFQNGSTTKFHSAQGSFDSGEKYKSRRGD